MNPKNLRKKFPVFNFEKYEWKIENNDLVINWSMGNQDYQFHPQVRIPGAFSKIKELPKEIIDNFVFHLGMVEIFSYWKAFCSPAIEIQAGYLDKYQLDWWHDLLIKGMGQYFYENEIDFRENDFVTFRCHCEDPAQLGTKQSQTKREIATPSQTWLAMTDEDVLGVDKKSLIAVGGGKDSAVTLELLSKKNNGKNIAAFALNPKRFPSIEKMVKTSGINKMISAERIIDPQLLQLNKEGYLNGHTPFSSYLAFLAVFMARLFGFDEVVFSNERSSNEGNVEYEGYEINHQYSKSLEFENNFREYNKRYLSNVNYFSLLRPLYELQIAKIFSSLTKYYSIFLSCNNKTKWCGKCPKCLSTFMVLYPFLKEREITNIFGKNLFLDESQIITLKAILGVGEHKPFECVVTFEEAKIAMYLNLKKTVKPVKLPLLKYFGQEVMLNEIDWEERAKKILGDWDKKNNLSKSYEMLLKREWL